MVVQVGVPAAVLGLWVGTRPLGSGPLLSAMTDEPVVAAEVGSGGFCFGAAKIGGIGIRWVNWFVAVCPRLNPSTSLDLMASHLFVGMLGVRSPRLSQLSPL